MAFETIREWIDQDDGTPLDWAALQPSRLVMLNMAIYLVAGLQFGVVWWKCGVVAIIVGLATGLNYGHRTLSRLGVVLLVAVLAIWTEAIPPVDRWQSVISSVITR